MTEKTSVLPHEPLSDENRQLIEDCLARAQRDRIGWKYEDCFNGIEKYYKTYDWLTDKQITALQRITDFTLRG